MKKLLRYLVNTILFIVIWLVIFLPVAYYSFENIRLGPSGLIAIGGIVAIIISYKLVKRINKSNLWASLFDETEVVNEAVEEKKVEVDKVKISKKRHLIKAVTWNLLAMTTTFFILSYLPPYFGFEPIDKSSVGWLVVLDRVAKLIFYYFHERTWLSSNWGVIKPKD